jgi:hypothetical protein
LISCKTWAIGNEPVVGIDFLWKITRAAVAINFFDIDTNDSMTVFSKKAE